MKADNLYEKEGPVAGGIDYEQKFLLHYIPQVRHKRHRGKWRVLGPGFEV